MKFLITDKGKRIRFFIPTFLINAATLRFIIRKAEATIDKKFNEAIPKLCKALRRFRRHHKHFILVEVLTKDHEHIKITL